MTLGGYITCSSLIKICEQGKFRTLLLEESVSYKPYIENRRDITGSVFWIL